LAQWIDYLNAASIIMGLFSAASWLRACFVKVSHEKAMALRARVAKKRGEVPNFASASLDGWDMAETFAAQSKWNSIGAFFAAFSVLLQVVAKALDYA